MDFSNVYAQGFARVAARVLPVHLAQPELNAQAIIEDVAALGPSGAVLVAYPELSLTGATCGDLFGQPVLLDAAEQALAKVVQASAKLRPVIVLGVPLRYGNEVFNCAAVVHDGDLLGVVPKSYLTWPNMPDQRRWFQSGRNVDALIELTSVGLEADFCTRQTFSCTDIPGLRIHVGFGDDLRAPTGVGDEAAVAGATVLVNIAACPVTLGWADQTEQLVRSASLRRRSVQVYAAAGSGESSSEATRDGQTLIYEYGECLAASPRFPAAPSGCTADVDLRAVDQSRRPGTPEPVDEDQLWMTTTFIADPPPGDLGLRRPLNRLPFIAADPGQADRDCREAFDIQVNSLVRRLEATGNAKPVIGISGGLDSTYALIIAAKAMDMMARPRTDILGFSLPGFGTSTTTADLAQGLIGAFGATGETIDIRPAAKQLLADLGHPYSEGQQVFDITFENIQAGLRADYLFRLANQRGGIVIGTGDLSESALGWCTYGVGDQMSHFALNAGVPKTLIRQIVHWFATTAAFDDETNELLSAVLNQEISPELVPADSEGRGQSTESTIGPYALHDFFLYHFLGRGDSPSRIAYLAWQAWADIGTGTWPSSWPPERRVSYDLAAVRTWLEMFLKRFFAHQFKRAAAPEGPAVTGVWFGAPGGWTMPADVSANAWLSELDNNMPDVFGSKGM